MSSQRRAAHGAHGAHDKISFMKMHYGTKRLLVWIACLSMLLTALAPSISHATKLAASKDAALTEICSSSGLTFAAQANAPESGAPLSGTSELHTKHCPYCVLQADVMAPAPSAMQALPVLRGKMLHPPLFYQSSHPLFAWFAAQPRAPPASA